jgi:transketolase
MQPSLKESTMNTVTEKKPRLTTSAMIASIASEGQRIKAAPFGKALVEYAQDKNHVVGLSADLAKYTDLHLFAQAFPERFFQMGMAEQVLMAAAGGMAKEGLIPFATTYAVFGTRRAYDFIHQVIAEENLNVKICCALPGLTTGYGPSHQATEDIAMMRAIPGMTVIDPCDALDLEQAVPQIAEHQGPVYMRLLRGNVPLVLDEYDYHFELGKAKVLRGGNEVLIIASGFMTMRALEAAKLLEQENISVSVLHVPTIKPLDDATILAEVRKPGRLVVVAENHSVIGGLGEAVASLLMQNSTYPTKFRLLALPDEFLDAGALPTLHDRYGISAEKVTSRIKHWLG